MKKLQVSLLLLIFTSCIWAAAANTQQGVKQAGQEWAAALSARDAQKITNLYAKDALLYATFTNMLDNQPARYAYFQGLVKNPDLKVVFDKQNIRLFGNTAINSGLYTFSFTDQGKVVTVPARYTFVYTLTPKGWMIVDHHSSKLPANGKS